MGLALTALLCGCGRTGSAGTGLADGAGEETGISNETEVNSGDAGSPGAEGKLEGNGTSADGGEMVPGNGKVSENGGNTSGNGGEAAGNDGETVENGGNALGSSGEAAGNNGSASGRRTGGRTEESAAARVTQRGPYGEISVMLPDGWKYEAFPMDSEELINGDYGIHFYPDSAAEGFVEIAYIDSFGVCGTGLAQENAEIAGSPAGIGTYDGHAYWDFVSFGGQNDGVVALTYQVEDWWDTYGDAVTGILDTLTFDREKKEGGAYVLRQESENQEIGLYFSLKNVSAAGATLVYNQFDADAPTGELQDSEFFIIERCRDGEWEEVPVIVEGDYGFHDIACNIPKEEITERALNWEWLYGQLAPGEYRIGKSILDFRKTADYDKYTIYAYFILE